jgi:hypothetical protein
MALRWLLRAAGDIVALMPRSEWTASHDISLAPLSF